MRTNFKTTCLYLSILFCLFVSFPATYAFSEDIKWYSYDEGMTMGKKEGKKIFLHFWANWCGYCTKMEKEAFKNSSVVSYLRKNYISIKVNTDRNQKIASNYFVRGLPTTWFLKENGEKISNLPGYIPPDMFLSILKFIHTDSYDKMTFGNYIKK